MVDGASSTSAAIFQYYAAASVCTKNAKVKPCGLLLCAAQMLKKRTQYANAFVVVSWLEAVPCRSVLCSGFEEREAVLHVRYGC